MKNIIAFSVIMMICAFTYAAIQLFETKSTVEYQTGTKHKKNIQSKTIIPSKKMIEIQNHKKSEVIEKKVIRKKKNQDSILSIDVKPIIHYKMFSRGAMDEEYLPIETKPNMDSLTSSDF